MANHSDPESCSINREVHAEALTGETSRPAIEPRNQESGMPTLLSEAEGNMLSGTNRKSDGDPTRSETLCMLGSLLHGSSEVSLESTGSKVDISGKVKDRTPNMSADEKSDMSKVPGKSSNKGAHPAEMMEGRDIAKGNADKFTASPTQSGVYGASMGLEGIRKIAREDKGIRFTALLHHITPSLLVESFYGLKRQAAAGVDGVSWQDYERKLYSRVHELHRDIHTGAYRAQPSRRVYIPKADGKQRPLGIAALEDKIVQQAVVTVLNEIYEADFLGFSYGFRKERGQHDALDALAISIEWRKVNWILDADIRSFFDEIDHEWMMRFLEHRIADKRILRLVRNWLKAGVVEDGKRVAAERGTPQGAVISPLLANIYLHYVFDQWVHQWRQRHAVGDVTVVRYADDSVMGFQYEGEARRFLRALRERMAKFGLSLHPDKTRLIRFGRYAIQQRKERGERKPETFDFLGFTHCCGQSSHGFKLVRLTIKKRMRATLAALRDAMMRKRHDPIPVQGRWLHRVIRGYLNYYAVPGNMIRLDNFRALVGRAWRKALLRRSQRNRMPWSRFARLVEKYLPLCRVVHPFPEERFRVKT